MEQERFMKQQTLSAAYTKLTRRYKNEEVILYNHINSGAVYRDYHALGTGVGNGGSGNLLLDRTMED
jgi:hypothetical protein